MPTILFEQLEKKVENLLETIEICQLEITELEAKNRVLEQENSALKRRQSEWEKGLQDLLGKLDLLDTRAILSPAKEEADAQLEY